MNVPFYCFSTLFFRVFVKVRVINKFTFTRFTTLFRCDDATVGIYNFQAGKMFVNGADAMIQKDKMVNGEFYVAPVYKELIEGGMNITIYDVSGRMHGLGTPEDLVEFEAHIK